MTRRGVYAAAGTPRHVVNNTRNNDIVLFYSAGLTIDLKAELSISKTLEIIGSGKSSPATIRRTAPSHRILGIRYL